MEKIAAAKLVEFRRTSQNSRKTFVNNLKNPKEPSDGGGGDYWITSVSAISRAFRLNKDQPIQDKVEELIGKRDMASANISKDMFQRNINVLNGFANFNMAEYKPRQVLSFIPRATTIIRINGVPVQVKPQQVFTFEDEGIKKIGATWFVAKLGGFEEEEVGLFTESLYEHLVFNFSKSYEIDARFCQSIDVVSHTAVRYEQIENEQVFSILDSTIDSIKSFL